MKKSFLSALTVLFLFSGMQNTYAQFDEGHERFHAQKIAFFTEKLQLTSDEAEKFWPVYNDYNNRKGKLEEESRSTLRYLNRNSGNMTEQEILATLDKYVRTQDELHKLFPEYHKEFLKILPPAKVAGIYMTEVQFRSFLLNQIRNVREDRRPMRR